MSSKISNSCCGVPLGPEEVEKWFDPDGRLVKEADMRKALFEVGVHPSCRRRLFKFLFGIYPMNSTTRDQKTIDIENRAHYIALRKRWDVLDRTISMPEEDLANSPWYMEYSDDEDEDDLNNRPPPRREPITTRESPTSAPTTTSTTTTRGSLGEKNNSSSSCSVSGLTESRDSGNFTEASFETSSEGIVIGSGPLAARTRMCSNCGRTILQGGRGGEVGGDSGEASVGGREGRGDEGEDAREGNGEERQSNTDAVESRNGSKRPDKEDMCSSCYQAKDKKGGGGGGSGEGLVKESSNGERSGSGASERSSGCGCDWVKRRSTVDVLDADGLAVLQILDFPSKVYAARLPVDLVKSYPRAKRIILRDVSRTDRNYHFFSHKRSLRKVHRILMIYSLFHPDLGYAQGMNDILARFLVMTDSEVDSYWLFKKYMERKKEDFLEDTMMSKVGLVKKLIGEMDTTLYDFFEGSECQDYLFCHRWLLLDFKREFSFDDSIRIFEVLSSHYLELDSDKALVETDKVIAKEFERDGGEIRSERSCINLGFTFDLFVCAAILTINSRKICKGTDAASVYGCLNSLAMNLNMRKVLSKAEELFYKYCRLTVTRGFGDILI